MNEPSLSRWSAFPAPGSGPEGGNPAGVVLDASALDDAQMLGIAAQLGYAESAFVTAPPDAAPGEALRATVRYFSPVAEVPFCGHATVATAVALTEIYGSGRYVFETRAGSVELTTEQRDGVVTASFTSVDPQVSALPEAQLADILDLLGLDESELDPRFPSRVSFAGNPHPMIVLGRQDTFDSFSFDPDAVRQLMDSNGWTGTITVLHSLQDPDNQPLVWEARNLFPVGTLSEDPATGSAAASTGAYLRALGVLSTPTELTIHQGRHIGRPSLLRVSVPPAGGITVTGTAHRID
ncbi:PhzF family phenazine biosynthesis protein [Psychromicrobium xiongbiense]|uniref:PhzF family phenazine biosynthesis protein n=1 Tax=Psychromicrobium xiongbiense TaxID=3051184 RepID=UPI002553D03D|nr:PhzF family phenazine biosynthesis protein [Psychromicrobium sp. YIM S02556]